MSRGFRRGVELRAKIQKMSKQTARPPRPHVCGANASRTFGGVLETAIDDGAEAFGLEDEILEAGGMDAYIVTSAQIQSTQRRGRKRVGWDFEKREVNVGCRSVEVGHCRRHGEGGRGFTTREIWWMIWVRRIR